jgi:hypothetical protein
VFHIAIALLGLGTGCVESNTYFGSKMPFPNLVAPDGYSQKMKTLKPKLTRALQTNMTRWSEVRSIRSAEQLVPFDRICAPVDD